MIFISRKNEEIRPINIHKTKKSKKSSYKIWINKFLNAWKQYTLHHESFRL